MENVFIRQLPRNCTCVWAIKLERQSEGCSEIIRAETINKEIFMIYMKFYCLFLHGPSERSQGDIDYQSALDRAFYIVL